MRGVRIVGYVRVRVVEGCEDSGICEGVNAG